MLHVLDNSMYSVGRRAEFDRFRDIRFREFVLPQRGSRHRAVAQCIRVFGLQLQCPIETYHRLLEESHAEIGRSEIELYRGVLRVQPSRLFKVPRRCVRLTKLRRL